jgi:diguanylate cyclase (GGDEF)-like protein
VPALEARDIWQGESALLAADGSEIPVSQVIVAHRGPDRRIRYLSSVARDIGERKAYEERITYLANYDALTGLPNRNLLEDRVTQAAAAYKRRAGRSFALLLIDIDRFRRINDGLGHTTGDALLKAMAERLCSAMREGDTVARLGSDLFGVLATELIHTEDIMTVVRKLRRAIAAPFEVNGRAVQVSVGIGASVFPRDGEDFTSLLRNAEAATHDAKMKGQAGFQFYARDMTREAEERIALENDLQQAMARGELCLHYQPQVSLQTGRIVGIEALMRWRRGERGYVAPALFIPIAEQLELIHDLGRWALRTACAQLKAWGEAAAGVRMAVNVSARQFRGKQLAEQVARAIEETGLDPARIEIELTESMLVENPEQARRTLEELKAIGVQLSLDDFGTGYSSLNYLTRFPLDCLKIDKSFVKRASEDKHSTVIIEGIILLAGALGLRVVAEGIETEEQLALLKAHGCDEGQGYLFSKPVAAGEVEALMQASATPRVARSAGGARLGLAVP